MEKKQEKDKKSKKKEAIEKKKEDEKKSDDEGEKEKKEEEEKSQEKPDEKKEEDKKVVENKPKEESQSEDKAESEPKVEAKKEKEENKKNKHEEVDDEMRAMARFVELLSGVEILKRMSKLTELVIPEKLLRSDEPTYQFITTKEFPAYFSKLAGESKTAYFVEDEFMPDRRKLDFQNFPVDLMTYARDIVEASFKVLTDENKESEMGNTFIKPEAVGISGELMEEALSNGLTLQAIKVLTIIRNKGIRERNVPVFTNRLYATGLRSVRERYLSNPNNIEVLIRIVKYVTQGGTELATILAHVRKYLLMFENPFDLSGWLTEVGYLTPLRIEGICNIVVPKVQYTNKPVKEIANAANLNLNSATVLRDFLSVSYSDNIGQDINALILSYFSVGYFKIELNYDSLKDEQLAGLAALCAKCLFSFSRDSANSMITWNTQVETDAKIGAMLMSTAFFESDGAYDVEYPLSSIKASARAAAPMRTALDRIKSNDIGKGWLNSNGDMRVGTRTLADEAYGTERRPIFISPNLKDYDSIDDNYFHILANQNLTYAGAYELFNVPIRGGGKVMKCLQVALIKMFCRINDYNLHNYATGFRMREGELNALNNTERGKSQIPIYVLDAKSLLYFMKCDKDLRLYRDSPFMNQLKIESNLVRDLMEGFIGRSGALFLRNRYDLKKMIWSDRHITDLMSSNLNLVMKYILDEKKNTNEVKYPMRAIKDFGILGPIYDSVLGCLIENSSAAYFSESFTQRMMTPVPSLEDYERKGKYNPVIFQNVVNNADNLRNEVTPDVLKRLIDQRKARYYIASKIMDGVRIRIPVSFKREESGRFTCVTQVLKIKDVKPGVDTPLRELITLTEVPWQLVLYDPAKVGRPDELVDTVAPVSMVQIDATPRIVDINCMLAEDFRGNVLYVKKGESFFSPFAYL